MVLQVCRKMSLELSTVSGSTCFLLYIGLIWQSADTITEPAQNREDIHLNI